MNLLVSSLKICVACLGVDYLSFSLSISSFNSINRVVLADAASARIYLPPDWTPSFFCLFGDHINSINLVVLADAASARIYLPPDFMCI